MRKDIDKLELIQRRAARLISEISQLSCVPSTTPHKAGGSSTGWQSCQIPEKILSDS